MDVGYEKQGNGLLEGLVWLPDIDKDVEEEANGCEV